MRKRNYYEILGISRDASQDEIKAAYRCMAKKYHPDMVGNTEESELLFKEINKAYSVLSDRNERSCYDRSVDREAPGRGSREAAVSWDENEDIFDAFFSRFGHSSRSASRSFFERDFERMIEIAFLNHPGFRAFATRFGRGWNPDGFFSTHRRKRGRTCPACGGEGKVTTVSRAAFGTITSTFPCPYCSGDDL